MKTLKTISVILPMTLLLACGSGGGYSGSIPEQTVLVEQAALPEQTSLIAQQNDKNLIVIEGSVEVPKVPREVDSNQPPSLPIEFQTTIENNPIDSYEFKHFGGWNIGIEAGEYFFAFKFNEGDILKDLPSANNDGFVYADYEGLAFVKRTNDGKVVSGNAAVSVTNDFGQLSSFQFNGFEGVGDIEFMFNFPIEIGQSINHTTANKGIRADFEGGNFIGGAFYDHDNNAEFGAFGATRIPLE